jgi:myo-inositol 2-dehydrogenase/D-chiro-inositol 1-dehydrogenase
LERSNYYAIMVKHLQFIYNRRKVEPLKVLVIGAGRMGSIRVEDLSSDSRISEVLVTNRSPEKAEALAAKFGAKAIDWALATKTTADAVVVAVGTDAHEEILNPILMKGLPVLCEKPISLDLASTEAVIALAKKSGSQIQIGFQRRFDPSIKQIKNLIETGEVGTLYSGTMTAHDKTPSAREFIAGSGGIFRDMHVHDFDLIRWLADSEVQSVFAKKAVREHFDYADFDDADVSSVIVTTVSGVQFLVTGTRHNALGQDVRLEIFGSRDSVSAGLNSRTPLHSIENQIAMNVDPYSGFVDRFREAFLNETRAFVSFALGEISNPCPPEAALESLRIAIACEKSILTKAEVQLSEVS